MKFFELNFMPFTNILVKMSSFLSSKNPDDTELDDTLQNVVSACMCAC